MAKAFPVKVRDMTPEERKACDFHNRKHGLIAKINKQNKEIVEHKEEMREATDPEYAALKKELRDIEVRQRELRLMKRKLEFDALPEKQKRIYRMIGWDPYYDEDKPIRRTTGTFTTREDK